MNKRNKLVFIFLATTLLFCLFAPAALAVSDGCCEITVGGIEDYTEAFGVLSLVNELRESLGVQPLVMDDTLMNYAMQRAAELAMLFDHTRPDSTDFNSGCRKAFGENIARGARTMSTAEEAYTAWYNSQGHYENMVCESFNSIGIGMFRIGRDYYWVQVFGLAQGSGEELSDYSEKDGVYTYTIVSVLEETVVANIEPKPEATKLLVGESIYIDMDCSTIYTSYMDPTGFTFTGSDNSVLTVDEYGIVTAVGQGTATVTISCPGLDVPWTIEFTVCAGHEYDDGVITVEPGCDYWDKGEMTYTCIHCGGSYTKVIYGSHSYDDGVITTEPTCGANGVRTYTCTRCGNTRTETIYATGEHNYDDGVVTTEPTCGANGVRTYTCARCGNSYTETIYSTGEHNYGDGVVTEEPTCKDWGTMTYTCAGCGDTRTESIAPHNNHTYGDGEVTREATCTYQGVIHYNCTVCNGGGYIETIDALGHAWDEGVITTQPTCAQQGWLTKTCTRCGATTMKNLGFSSEHTWDEGTVIRLPSLIQSGEILYTCTLCTATKTEPLDFPEGDVSGDGQTDAADVVVLMKHVLGDPSPVNENATDVNGDNRTDILDIIRLIRWLADKDIDLN